MLFVKLTCDLVFYEYDKLRDLILILCYFVVG